MAAIANPYGGNASSIGGVTVSGTPTTGEVITAETGTTADWQASGSGSANALNSATTTVNVSSSTAPYSGEILIATSSTAATWQANNANGLNTTGSAVNVQESPPIAGQVLTASGEYNAGWATPTPFIAEPLTSGEAVIPRCIAGQSTALTTQVVQLTYWTAVKTESCSHVTTYTGGTASGAPSYSAIGIYSVNTSNGNLTLLQSTGDLHTTMWAATYTTYQVSLTSAFSKVAGTLYAVGFLTVDAEPTAIYGDIVNSAMGATSPLIFGTYAGQTTLPSTIAGGSIGAGPTYGFVPVAIVAP